MNAKYCPESDLFHLGNTEMAKSYFLVPIILNYADYYYSFGLNTNGQVGQLQYFIHSDSNSLAYLCRFNDYNTQSENCTFF